MPLLTEDNGYAKHIFPEAQQRKYAKLKMVTFPLKNLKFQRFGRKV